MKRTFRFTHLIGILVISALLVGGLLLYVAPASAEVVASGYCGAQGDNLSWTLDDEGLLTISGTGDMKNYDSNGTDWGREISQVIVGKGVTSIGDRAFYGCTGLTSITLPDSLTSIGSEAFYNCIGLTSISLPDSLTAIDDYAFWGCHKVILTAPEGTYAYQWAEDHGMLMETAILESEHPYAENTNETWTYTSPSEAAALRVTFSKRTELSNLDSVITITDAKRSLTYGGTELAGETLILVGNSFELNLLQSTGWWGSYSPAFGFRITSIEAMSDEEYQAYTQAHPYSTAALSDGTLQITEYIGSDTDVTVPSEIDGIAVTSIGSRAFYENTIITSVKLPEGLTSIGSNAFYGCTSLCSVMLPESLKSIGWLAFCDCTSLASIDFPDGLTNITEQAFTGCTSLTSITLPESLTYMSYSVFSGCTALVSFLVPEGNTAFSAVNGILYNKDGTVLMRVPEGFSGSLTVPDGVSSIDYDAFSGCKGVTSITLPESLTQLSGSTFSACSALASIQVAEGNTAFSSVDGILFNKEVTELKIVPASFSGSFTVPDSVTSIGSGAFAGCTGLTGITLPDSVTSIGDDSFSYCTGLTSITLPDSVTSIGSYAFSGCTGLTDITLPEGITRIEFGTFSYCSGLTSIILPDSVTGINDYAFSYCTGLTSITLPDSLTFMGFYAFSGCTGLTSIKIPETVTKIEWRVFFNCTGLKSITLPESVTSIDEGAFEGCTSLMTVYCYIGSYAAQWAAEKGYTIEYLDFMGYTKVLTLPAGVVTIEEEAFANLTIEKVVIPSGTQEIGARAFAGCADLKVVEMPNSVTAIGEGAFSGCGDVILLCESDNSAAQYARDNGLGYMIR